ncbi:hypothetical protein Dimus_035850 [Dionaea muscipula]
MATISGVSLSVPRFPGTIAAAASGGDLRCPSFLMSCKTWRRSGIRSGFGGERMAVVKPVRAAPEQISEKVAESVKLAEEVCAGNPVSGECVAAWDEVEELSAAASHARDRKKETDVLETFCKDNPESEECRTYED